MRWSICAGVLGFALVELAALAPIAQIASVTVKPTLRGGANEAAITWALSTRDPYLDVETVRGFRDVVLAGRAPDAETLTAYLRDNLSVSRQGDALVLSVRARDGDFARSAAEFFGGRLHYFTRRAHGAMGGPRIEWLAFRGYELRRRAGLTPIADAAAPPPLLTADERARLATVDRAVADELEKVDDELRFWTSPVKSPADTAAAVGSVWVRGERRFGTWPAHIVSLGVGLALISMAALVGRILRRGADPWSAALSIAMAGAPVAATVLAGSIAFRARAHVTIERHGPSPDEPLVTTFLRGPDRFLDAEHFVDLWPRENVEASAGAPRDLRSFTLPRELSFRPSSDGFDVELVHRDVSRAEQTALGWAHRVAAALQRTGGLARFRERANLPQKIRAAEGRIRWHETMLSTGNLSPDLDKLHRDQREADLKILGDAKLRVAAIDAAPMSAEVVRVHHVANSQVALASVRRSRTAVLALAALVAMAAFFVWSMRERVAARGAEP